MKILFGVPLVVALGLFASLARAGVLAGSISASASGTGGGSISTNFGGITSTSQLPAMVADDNTGQGAGFAYGDAFGHLTLASHACVEPNAFSGTTSAAGGSGAMGFSDTYSIQSSTLVDGTPVSVDFFVAAGLNKQNNDSIAEQSQTQTSNTAQASFGAGGNFVSGAYNFSEDRLHMTSTTGGLFDATQVTEFTVLSHVGQFISVSAQINGQTTAFVSPGDMGTCRIR